MRNLWFSLVLAAFLVALPLSISALGLDIEAKAGGGLALGWTTNPNQTGTPGPDLVGGVDIDIYPFSFSGVDLGFSVGAEYAYLTNHGSLSISTPFGNTTLKSDASFNYLIVPVAVSSRIPLSSGLDLAFRAGGFIGYFLGGSSTNTYNPEIVNLPFISLTNNTTTLDSSTTVQWMYGLHFTGGADIRLAGNLFLAPSIVFDMGLTNTTGTSGYTYSDTLWSISAMIGVKYSAF